MADPTGDVRLVVRALNRFAEKHIKIITLDATANLIEDTPVDTGWASNNWVPSIGSPSSFVGDVKDPQPSDVSTARAASDSGVAQVATGYKLPMGSVFISNNVPYIRRLNDGHSKQAPKKFVEAAITRAVRGAFKAGEQTV